jgi:hypothetical protein
LVFFVVVFLFFLFECPKRTRSLKEEQKFFLDIGIVSKIFSLCNAHICCKQVEKIFFPKKKNLSL